MLLSELREKTQSMEGKVIAAAGESILENKRDIINIVIDQQYEQSVDSTGKPLRDYAPGYRIAKEKDGLYRGKTDFSITGDMHLEMNLTVKGREYTIDSPSTTKDGILKSAFLKTWQGSPIMDLTDENILVAREIAFPTFLEKVNEFWD